MTPDPKHSLQLAFQHLDSFSVPGVGTFRRRYFGAVIDHQSKNIDPPSERFVLEKGESKLAQLEDFFFRHFDLKIDRARALVQEVGEWVLGELKKAGRLLLPGWGELQKADQEIDFVHDDSLTANADPFFGLGPVKYSLGDMMSAGKEEKRAAAAAGVAANTTLVEPPPPPRKRRRRGWIIIVLILLLLGSGAGMIWPDKFLGFVEQIGLYSPGDKGDIASNGDPKKPDVTPPVDTTSTGETDLEPDLVDPVQPVDPDRDRDRGDSGDKPGVFAQSGMYYLIVSATSSADDARQLRREFRKGGVTPTILKSRGRGFYKISVFQSTDKMAVINKMVEWKDAFPDKSWIYWIGM